MTENGSRNDPSRFRHFGRRARVSWDKNSDSSDRRDDRTRNTDRRDSRRIPFADARNGGICRHLRDRSSPPWPPAPDHVTVHTYPGPGHYGRSNGGNAGGEDEAVILSQALGKPVRVQWMRADDIQWSTQSAAALADIEIAFDQHGKIVAFQVDHYMPAMQDDRLVGAVLAGLPTMAPPNEKGDFVTSTALGIADPW